jgi:hypothetical protein
MKKAIGSAFAAVGSILLAIAGLGVLLWLGSLWVYGVAWVSVRTFEYLISAAHIMTAVCILIFLPLAIFRFTRVVKYRGPVDLKQFTCDDVSRSSFIKRVCYDKSNEYMVISLNATYYHYCEINAGTVSSLLGAESMGRFYNASIKGRFDCRTHRVPAY